MLNILVAGAIALAVSLLGTPLFIRFLVRREFGQFIRQDGPTAHFTKRGTPTMGGIVIIGATVLGYFGSGLVFRRGPAASGLLLLFLMAGLGLVGFLDDFTKIRRQRSLGLSPTWKFAGQGAIGIAFAVLAMFFPGGHSGTWTPGSTRISFLRDTNFDLAFGGKVLGVILFVVWANFLITAWSNAVNLTDGLDGLATGSSAMAFAAYAIVALWQTRRYCGLETVPATQCYAVRDPWDVAVFTAAIMGACLGFLWWNASPAKIFMGDTGALALGGAFAGLSIVTRTELLAAIIGGLFVLIVLSDVIQIGWFKLTGKRVFKMAPLHHHFELSGWGEVTIVIRFWLVAVLFVAVGVGLFYGETAVQLAS
jgi:phospho-N-acetylmuramoyl-pentapeptide-transferase